ncbi:MAG TPA: hypothetical protein VMS65_15650 [Polyangiaceae bacterium]|nr:hypothetical protein [Polyangiaceae bacterium]
MRAFAIVLFGLSLGGCLNFGKVDDAKIPGDLLGTYAVQGALVESDCGEGALGSTNEWSFDVKLSRFHDDLYWINGREVIPGGVEPDGVSFAFTTRVEAEVLPTAKGRPACVLSRADSAKGTLSSDSSDVETFDATLTFSYSAVAGSDCELWVGGPDTVAALPCSMSYDLTGSRMGEAPEPNGED